MSPAAPATMPSISAHSSVSDPGLGLPPEGDVDWLAGTLKGPRTAWSPSASCTST